MRAGHRPPMHWIYLFAAIAFEISGTTCMKLSEGFTRLWPSVGIFVFYASSIACLTLAVKVIDMKSIRDSIAKEMLQCEI